MIKNHRILIIVCLMLGLMAVGCGQNKSEEGSQSASAKALAASFVGTWTQVTDDGTPSLPDLGIPTGYLFRDNGTGVDLFWDMPFSYTITGDVIHISYDEKNNGEVTDYQYVFEGDTLQMTRTGDPEAVTMLYRKSASETESEGK